MSERKFSPGDTVTVQLSGKHTLHGDLVQHSAKFVRYHSDAGGHPDWADVELEAAHSAHKHTGQRVRRLSVPLSQIVAALLLLFLFSAVPSRAQDIGNVGLRTVEATLTTNQTCSGGAQTYSTSSPALNALGFRNIGQTHHVITLTGSGTATLLQAEIDGIDTAGNVYPISDRLRLPSFFSTASLQADGLFANIQIQVKCSPNTATYTLSYSGTFTTQANPVGSYQTGQIDKIIFNGITAGSSQSDSFQTPFGNSAGAIYLSTAGGGVPAGSSVTVSCTSAGTGVGFIDVFTLQAQSAPYAFPVSPGPCPVMSLTYVSGGASANTFSLEYVFFANGLLTGTYAYAPAQLGVNALTEPAAGTSALSNIIDTRGAKNARLSYSCTAGTITMNVQTYSEDTPGNSTLTTQALVSPVSGVAAATSGELYIDSESNPSVSTGTLATPPAGVVRFPQPYLAFSFTNAGGAGTCTARLFVTY